MKMFYGNFNCRFLKKTSYGMPAVTLLQRSCFMLYPASIPQAENMFQKAGQ